MCKNVVEIIEENEKLVSAINNFLELTKKEFMISNIEAAQQHAHNVAFKIYNDPLAKDKFWQYASTDLLTAFILGFCEHCKEEPQKITMKNIALMMIDLSKQTFIDLETGVEKVALDKFFEQFEPSHIARMQFAKIDFTNGQMGASVLSYTTSRLGVFATKQIIEGDN
ncbi:hypothetical protein [Lysinibacillus fusiformis]|uniref:hypothetical protein n=1 Tax=Lysinibacillus fusiformis TaxID=28031 RepID=UPI000D361C41|nr:hypothetical protein [Lysinibacillus fusiformis]MED4672385.1 hypothetical protein [Lysinibacillus fusiformis]RDV32220.1 hypothetical protein C7B90_10875 [Lysinibacillus fusiformis]GED65573.1 hypothetical protein LFU01_40250 [Lysinibacillus fusiformis]